jgi:hypothetical protein
MAYAFVQRVVEATPEELSRKVRSTARAQGFEEGPLGRKRGWLGERMAPLAGGRVTGRLWVWPITSDLSVAYLGLESPAVPVPGIAQRLRRMAERLLVETDVPTRKLGELAIAS